MTLANSVVAKLSVAFVALATAFVLAAPAQAQMSESEMQSEIDRLTALIEQLTASLGGDTMTGGNTSSVCPYTWTRSLSQGDSGMDVKKLQQFLNSNELTRVAATGVGSAGMETEYYGALTGAAVASFQELNRAAILTPLGLVNSTMFFGPSTMAEANKQCASAPVMDDDADDTMDDDASDDDDSSDTKTLGDDEGSLDNIDEVSADESNLEEGKTMGLFAFTVEVEGDVEVDRLDVYLDSASAAGTESDNADDYFEGAELWVDGDMVATLDVSDFDEDDYAKVDAVDGGTSDEFRLRFSGLGLVFEDGDEPEFQIALEAIGNIDGDDETETWGFDNPSFRYVDGQGFTDTLSSASVEDTFGFDEEEKAEIDITKSSDSPDAKTVEVDDNDESSEIEIFVVNIEEQNGVDVMINEMTMTASTTEGDVTTTIDEVILYVDGDEVGSDSPTSGGALTFDNLEIELDGEGEVDVVAKVVFKGTDSYDEGDSVFLTFNAITEAEDENGNDEGEFTGANPSDFDSETFTLRSEGIEVTAGDHDFYTQGSEDTTGVFEIEFEVTAFGDDFYIAKNATSTDDDTDGGVNYTVTSGTTPTSVSGSLSSTADEDTTDVFTVNRGETETFTLKVVVDAAATGLHSVLLDDIWFTANTDGVTSVETDPASPATDYRVVDENINN